MIVILAVISAIIIFIVSVVIWNIPLNWILANRDLRLYGEIRPSVGGMPLILRIIGIIISYIIGLAFGKIIGNDTAAFIGFCIRATLYIIIRY